MLDSHLFSLKTCVSTHTKEIDNFKLELCDQKAAAALTNKKLAAHFDEFKSE